MRLFLLGCTGFIGRELVPTLISNGHQLTILTRQKSDVIIPKIKGHKQTFIQTDPTDLDTWRNSTVIKALEDSEGIINLAGEPIAEKRWTKKHCEKILNSRVITSQRLMDAISKLNHHPQCIINASAIGYYGTSQTKVFNENSASGKDFLANLCQQWENISQQKPNDTRLAILRIGIVLGNDGGALGKMLPIFRAGFGGHIGSGKQWMSWIHRTDLCRIISEALINQDFSEVINCVAPNQVTMKEFAEVLGKSLHRPSLLPVPGPILQLLLGDGAKVVLEGQKVHPKRLIEIGIKFKYPKISEALYHLTK